MAKARRTFETALECVRRIFGLHVYGYVVMPEHVHLLISEPQRGTLAEALKSLEQGVSRRLIGEAQHFWQKRYYDFNIRTYRHFVEKRDSRIPAMTSEEERFFKLLNHYSRRRYQCFLAEMFLNEAHTEYILCFRLLGAQMDSGDRYACRYLHISPTELKTASQRNALTSAMTEKLDEELSALHHRE